MTTIKRPIRAPRLLAACFTALVLLPTFPAIAQSPAETLEKGIYSEETEGNLDKAIEHYRQVLLDTQKTRGLAAQAQFRLARCLSKLGKQAEAEAAFEAVVKNYPDQKELVAKAKRLMPGQLTLQPAPWKSGEQLTLTMKLPNGQPIGIVGTSVRSAESDGKKTWVMTVRRHINARNSGVSQATVDQESNLPMKTVWDHTMLGKANASWSRQGVSIEKVSPDGSEEKSKVDFPQPSYCNDQWFFGFRQIEMKIGNKVSIPIRVAFTGGNGVEMKLEVAGKEEVKTPVGTFECFRLETNIQQTFWITDTPERYVARFDAGGVTAVLSDINDGNARELKNDALGFSVNAPAGWFCFEPKPDNKATMGAFKLIAPHSIVAATIEVQTKSLLDAEERTSADAWADEKLKGVKASFEDVQVRTGSRKTTDLAGQAGVSFIIDYLASGRAMSAAPTLAFDGDKAIEWGVYGDKTQFDELAETLNTLRESVKVE